MTFSLSDEVEKLIEERIRTGHYLSADEVILAGLASLEQAERFGEFAPGEWDALLQSGEQSLSNADSIDAAQALRALRSRIEKPKP